MEVIVVEEDEDDDEETVTGDEQGNLSDNEV
jgi:hypothetical protein